VNILRQIALFLIFLIVSSFAFVLIRNDGVSDISKSTSYVGLERIYTRQTMYNWTIMIYLDGDNNLESAALNDFLEISDVGSTDEISLIVLLDRWNGTGSDDNTSYDDWTEARIFYVDKSEQPYADKADIALGEINMGSYSSIVRLVNYSVQNYPAEHYALILWDHGLGFQGLCLDEDNGNDILFFSELRLALEKIYQIHGIKIDVLGIDACLMGIMELVYAVRDYVDYIVFSQEYEAEDGWPYDRILAGLVSNPSMSPQDLASMMVDEYVTYYSEPTHSENNATLSAIDVEKFVKEGIPSLNRLTGYIMSNYLSLYNNVSYAINNAEEYGCISPCYTFEKDIIDFLENLKNVATDTNLISLINDAIYSISSSIVSARHLSGHPNSYGISAIFDDACLTSSLYNFYRTIEISQHQQWDEFLAKTRVGSAGIWFYDMRIEGTDSNSDGYLDENISLIVDLDSEGAYNLTIMVYGRAGGDEYLVGYEEYKYVSGVGTGDQILVRLGIPKRGIYDLRLELYDNKGSLIKQYYYYCDADLIGLKFGRTEYQIDTSPPTIVILQPENNTVFYGETEIDFSISVNDNLGIDRIIIYVNGTKIYQFNQTVSSFTLIFYQYGTFNITIEAVDLVGNSNTVSVIIHLKESGGGPGPEIDMNLLIAIIAILLIIVIVIIILKRE